MRTARGLALAGVLGLAATLGLAAAGCGNGGGGGASAAGVLSATFANFGGATTSGVAISSPYPSCTQDAAGALTCTAAEFADGAGRSVSVSFGGPIVAGMDYRIGDDANVFFRDPTTFGTAMGERQWQAIAGTGTVHVVAWTPTSHVGFSYAATMQPLGSGAEGTFDLTGDANINAIRAQ